MPLASQKGGINDRYKCVSIDVHKQYRLQKTKPTARETWVVSVVSTADVKVESYRAMRRAFDTLMVQGTARRPCSHHRWRSVTIWWVDGVGVRRVAEVR